MSKLQGSRTTPGCDEIRRGHTKPIIPQQQPHVLSQNGASHDGVLLRRLTPAGVLALQRTVGNRALQRMLGSQSAKGLYQLSGTRIQGSTSAPSLLNRMPQLVQRAGKLLIQRTVIGESDYGRWEYLHYGDPKISGKPNRGAEIVIQFTPNEKVKSSKIGFIQAINWIAGGKPMTSIHRGAIVAEGEGKGTRIDRGESSTNPIYGGRNLREGQTLADTQPNEWSFADAINGQAPSDLRQNILGNASGEKKIPARMYDRAVHLAAEPPAQEVFETTALDLSGEDGGIYYGSIEWGWRVTADRKYSRLTPSIKSQGMPSKTFFKVAEKWNEYVEKREENQHKVPIPADVDIDTLPSNPTLTYNREEEGLVHLTQKSKKKDKDKCIIC
ncbi:MAG: hypothetical protein KatS3mg057_2451 [Herpetosiphonaceae bacterium]|nr:MAG: hypothetical protein KatS3mg057_2451 [Herpetosiphonaceae bacterium]